MPVLIFGLGALALGAGIRWAGQGVEDTADGISKVIVVSSVAGAAYFLAKKSKVI